MSDHDRVVWPVEPLFEDSNEEWLTNEEAARLLGLKPDTLRDYRAKRRSPRFYKKRGFHVLYRRSDLDAFISNKEASDV